MDSKVISSFVKGGKMPFGSALDDAQRGELYEKLIQEYFAADNAHLNGFTDFELLPMDWRRPPRDRRWRLILASDLIYEMRNVEPLVGLIEALLAPDGECLLTDQDRVPSHVLKDTLTARGLPFTTQVTRAGEPGGRRLKGTLYRIRLGGGQGAGS